MDGGTELDPTTLRVGLGARSYDVVVGPALIEQAGRWVKPLRSGGPVFVVSDDTVAGLHGARLRAALGTAEMPHHWITVPAGESSKDFAHLETLIDQLLAAKVERGSLLIALGGGVVGDLAGFAAAVVLRGIDVVQIPTTLLSQVDSSVGGKTGINTRRGKNLVGAFHQPRLVLADIDTLATLPRRELLAGYAEVVKYGVLGDLELFQWLEHNGRALIDGDDRARTHAVIASCRAKAAIVAEDERERGRRALLNLGHTFGHALEAEVGYGPELLHGEAVAIGLVMATALSAELGLGPGPADVARLRAHFEAVGLPVAPPPLPGRRWDADALLEHMTRDKKVAGGHVTFVLLRAIGDAFVHDAVPPAAVRAVLGAAIAAAAA